MIRAFASAAVLCALAVFASRAWADVPQKAAEQTKTPIWEQQPNLTLDSKDETKPLLLADPPSELGKADYSDNWRFRTFTTIWVANITGTVGRGDYEADLDIGFSDIIDKATVLTLNFEFGKGPWSVIFFGLWMKIEDDIT